MLPETQKLCHFGLSAIIIIIVKPLLLLFEHSINKSSQRVFFLVTVYLGIIPNEQMPFSLKLLFKG